MKKLISAMIAVMILAPFCVALGAELTMQSDEAAIDVSAFEKYDAAFVSAPDISAPSAILIEKETGTVIFEKNADERLSPASVTKVMTILLIVEEIESGNIALEDTVTASARASSMGGSQIFLRENETMSVRDMLKSIIVSSANDAAVAMAEHISGSESAFVERMNRRAADLGMANTVFMNCTGLLEQPEHLTTARDISLMSRELLKHDWIREYTTIWTDSVRGGEFGLSNTNKLIRYYSGATGLKTGFTSTAGYCLSASAMRDGVEYIAVVMHCDTSQHRFESAKALLSYAFSNYTLISARPDEAIPPVEVKLGEKSYIQPVYVGDEKILIEKSKASSVEKTLSVMPVVNAPVNAGDKLGTVTLTADGEVIYSADIAAEESVARLTLGRIYKSILKLLIASVPLRGA